MRCISPIAASLCLLSLAVMAGDNLVLRTDLSDVDLVRVGSVTQPTQDFSTAEPFEAMSGGAATTKKLINRDIFSQSSANISFAQEQDFKLGNALFRKLWVGSPSSTLASDGLGPLFNARSCQGCHVKDGRGHPPENSDDSSISMFYRLSIAPQTPEHRAALTARELQTIPEPTYGGQMQDLAIQGHAGEGRMSISYVEEPVTLDDGTIVFLRRPSYDVEGLGYGEMHEDVQISPRIAPQMIGLGLLEAIPFEDILALADPKDANGDGVSGKPSWVRGINGEIVLGRFGLKASKASLRSQTAAAFAGDIGISSEDDMRHSGDCTAFQIKCLDAPTGVAKHLGTSEAPHPVLDLVTFYSQNLAVPARRNVSDSNVLRGKEVFYDLGCTSCHNPKFVTSRNATHDAHKFQLIWPYTDMLLHNMGSGLADHRPDGDANGFEWRTPPLWGIGLTKTVSGHTYFLHDGRARNLTEAILWHDGEAQAQRDGFAALNAQERHDLLSFLESL